HPRVGGTGGYALGEWATSNASPSRSSSRRAATTSRPAPTSPSPLLFVPLVDACLLPSLAASIAVILESGILLAAAYFATRTLWLPIGLHFGWNFAEDFVFGARISGHAARPAIVEGTLTGSSLWTGGAYGLESSVGAIVMAAILSAVLIAIAIRSREIVPFMPNRNRKFAAAIP